MKDCDVHALHTSLGQGVLVFRKLSSQPCRHNQLTAHWEVRIKDGLTCKRKGLKECTGGPGASACSQQDAPASAAKALGPRALAAGIAFHSTSSSNVPAVVFPSWAMNFTLRMILKSWDTCVQSSCKKSGPSPITQCIARRLDVPLRALMQFVSREASPSLLSPFWCGHVLCLSRADGDAHLLASRTQPKAASCIRYPSPQPLALRLLRHCPPLLAVPPKATCLQRHTSCQCMRNFQGKNFVLLCCTASNNGFRQAAFQAL